MAQDTKGKNFKNNNQKNSPDNQPQENSLQSALRSVGIVNTTSNNNNDINKPNRIGNHSLSIRGIHQWEGDGIDHINIGSAATTNLGILLSVECNSLSFKHKHFGTFKSINCFWAWITSENRDDRVRNMNSNVLRFFSKEIKKVHIVNFRAIIIDTMYQRIKSNKVLSKMLIESTLPFDVYHINPKTGVPSRPKYFEWFILGTNEIRRAMKEGQEPDLNFLIDNRIPGVTEYNIYEHVVINIGQSRSKAELKQMNIDRVNREKELANLVRGKPQAKPVKTNEPTDKLTNKEQQVLEKVIVDDELADNISNVKSEEELLLDLIVELDEASENEVMNSDSIVQTENLSEPKYEHEVDHQPV